MINKNSGQVWIETIIYTLIGLTVIGILLTYAAPKIEEKKDQIIISQASSSLKDMRSKIEDIKDHGEGNSRVDQFKIEKGILEIDGREDLIKYSIEGDYKYSEPNKTIEKGGLIITTEKTNEKYNVELLLNYSEKLNITYNDNEETKQFVKAATPYQFVLANDGGINITKIDFSIK